MRYLLGRQARGVGDAKEALRALLATLAVIASRSMHVPAPSRQWHADSRMETLNESSPQPD